MSHEIAERPWEKIGTDLYTIDGKEYLIVDDYFSNFWEIDPLPDRKASTVIKKLKCHFARQGVPDTVISDNGPQFASVKEAKRLLRKSKETSGNIYLALLALRNKPKVCKDTSPAQRLLGRRCKTQLPTAKQLLKPQTIRLDSVWKERRTKQQKQSKYYNRAALDLTPLEEGDEVRMRPFRLGQKTWQKATVTKRHDERSYEVETDFGAYRRNRADLKQRPPHPHPHPQEQPVTNQQLALAEDQNQPADTPTMAPETNCQMEVQPVVLTPARQRPKRTIREPA
ncbi:hypothetical protein QZH41_012149 [Actinostola sp. cb2023]|nr:hypothetical protein QZH41_012149 [Actinostola sp. cb2023]